jgi:AraC-like DNA-binding protein
VNIKEDEAERMLQKLDDLFNIEKIYAEPQLKISTVADRLGVNTGMLSHLINQYHNKSFADFLNEHRLNAFMKIALEEKYAGYSIFGLAQEVGYRNKSSFNLAFKKKMGLPPGEYMRSKLKEG